MPLLLVSQSGAPKHSSPLTRSYRLPRIAALFDPSTQQNSFKGSKVAQLEELALTETQLLEQTAALLGVSLAQLVRAGALVYAKREFLSHKKYLSPSPPIVPGSSHTGVRSSPSIAFF